MIGEDVKEAVRQEQREDEEQLVIGEVGACPVRRIDGVADVGARPNTVQVLSSLLYARFTLRNTTPNGKKTLVPLPAMIGIMTCPTSCTTEAN